MLVVGSAALHLLPGFESYKPRDLDLIAFHTELPEIVKFWKPQKVQVNSESSITLFGVQKELLSLFQTELPIVEVEIAWPGTVAERINSVANNFHGCYTLSSLDELYTLKMSHRYKKNTPHFEKTRRDILEMRRFKPRLLSWFADREKETLNYNHPKLNEGQTKAAFFSGDGVQYFFDHDLVHEVVARIYNSSQPAYQLYLKEGEAVACDRRKFENLPFRERIRGVCEEATVLALERSQIPARLDPAFAKDVDPTWSFRYALQKVCTSITSGWFREFAWENYDEALSSYKRDYAVDFWKEVNRAS